MILRIFCGVFNSKGIINHAYLTMQIFNNVMKIVTFLSSFLESHQFFPLFQDICVVHIVTATVFVETVPS